MAWCQVAFELEAERTGLAEAALESLGAVSVTWGEAEGSAAVLEPAPGETRLWDRVQVTALFESDTDAKALFASLTEALGEPLHGWQASTLADQAWERAWLEHFRPLHCGGDLWVVPSDQTPPDPAAVNVRLDPGLAFGTGTHPTTALCLQALAAEPPVGETVIDYGCGSGLLAIAALKLGAEQVIAIDNDPQALLATEDNARRNEVDARLIVAGPEAPLPQADRVLANILAGILQSLAPRLIGAMTANARLTLAGLLSDQVEAVQRAYEPAVIFSAPVEQDGWVRLDGRHRSL